MWWFHKPFFINKASRLIPCISQSRSRQVYQNHWCQRRHFTGRERTVIYTDSPLKILNIPCFKYMFCFQVHLVSHTGVKAFSCLECGKCFGYNNKMKRHMKTVHTSHKPFECSTCGKRFALSFQLKVHTLTHSQVRRFSCSQCEKCFISSSRLKDHMTVHSGKRPFACEHCGKGFVRREHLKYHMNAIHGKQVINPWLVKTVLCNFTFVYWHFMSFDPTVWCGDTGYINPYWFGSYYELNIYFITRAIFHLWCINHFVFLQTSTA